MPFSYTQSPKIATPVVGSRGEAIARLAPRGRLMGGDRPIVDE